METLKKDSPNLCRYNPGDSTKTGHKIDEIFACDTNYAIYLDDKNHLCLEIETYDASLNQIINRFRDLALLAETSLSNRYIRQAQTLLAQALLNAFSCSTDEQDILNCFAYATDFIDEKRHEIVHIYAKGPDFIVYKSNAGEIQWWSSELSEHLPLAIDEFQHLKTLILSKLPTNLHFSLFDQLGYALGSAFRVKTGACDVKSIFDRAKDLIFKQIEARYRFRYLTLCASSTALISVSILLLYYYLASEKNQLLSTLFFGSLGGVLGSFLSILQRGSKTLIDIYSPLSNLVMEGLARLMVGFISGPFVVLASKSDMVLGSFKDNTIALIVFAIISGFCERFVPNLITSITNDNHNKHHSTPS